MEIDIFPIPSKKGIHRYLGPAMLGLLVISYVVGATLLARRLVGIDNEMFCFLVAVLLFYRRLFFIYIVVTWHQTMSLFLLQEQ